MRRFHFLMLLLASSLFLLSCRGGSDRGLNYCVIWKGNLYGYIDESGKMKIPLQFAYAMPFSPEDSLGGVNIGGVSVNKRLPENGKWGFVNHLGEFVINPKYYPPPFNSGAPYDYESVSKSMHQAYQFSEGLAAVYDLNRWMYIDRYDRPVIVFDNERPVRAARKFSNGLANVFVNGKWGYINRQGEMVIEPAFILPADFHHGYALVMDKDQKRYLIDQNGNPKWEQFQFHSTFSEDFAAVKRGKRGDYITLEDEKKLGLFSRKTGLVTAVPEFDQVGQYGNGLCPVRVGSTLDNRINYPDEIEYLGFVGGKWGYADSSGRMILNPTFDGARGFHEGLAAARKENLWGYINTSGNWVIEPSFMWAGDFVHGIAKVKIGYSNAIYNKQEAYVSSDSREVIWIEGQK